MNDMDKNQEEMEISIIDLLKSVTSRIWLVILSFIVCVAVAVVYLINTLPVYEVSSSIMIEPVSESSSLQNLFSSAAFSKTKDISTEMELLNSKAAYRNALSKMDLTRYTNSEGVRYSDFEKPLDYGNLHNKVTITSVKDTNFLHVTVQDTNPEFARDFCNALTESFSDILTSIARDSASSQLEFISDQIPLVEEQLKDATLALSDFQRDNSIIRLTEQNKLLLKKLTYYTMVREPLKEERLDAEKAIAAFEKEHASSASFRIEYTSSEEYRSLKEQISAWYKEALLYDVIIASSESQLQVLSDSQMSRYYDVNRMIADSVKDIENHIVRNNSDASLEYASDVSQYLLAGIKIEVLDSEELLLNLELEKIPDIQRQVIELESEVEIYTQMVIKLREMESETAMLKASISENVTEVDAAELPLIPVSPSKAKILLIGGFLGIFIGVGLAVVLGLLDKKIKNRDELQKATGENIPILGWIPLMRLNRKGESLIPVQRIDGIAGGNTDTRSNIVLFRNPMCFISERYKHIASALIYGRKLTSNVITVCSPGKTEGKSTTLANIAYALALNGKKVLVVDFDLRVPAVEKTFEITRGKKGIVDILSGEAEVTECIRTPFVHLENLNVIGVGSKILVPSMILQQNLLEAFIRKVRPHYDFIFLDAPPLVYASELMTITRVVQEVFIVTRAGVSRSDEIRILLSDLASCGANLVGTCLNGLALKETSFGSKSAYGYGYGYGDSAESSENIKRSYVYSPNEYGRVYRKQLKNRLKKGREEYYFDAPLSFPQGFKEEIASEHPVENKRTLQTDDSMLDSYLEDILSDEEAKGRR